MQPLQRRHNKVRERRLQVSTQVSSWLNFTPLSLNPQLWLDAADATTITESGGAITQWNDKSGNNYHVGQATGVNQPTLVAVGQNGLNVIDFDGSNDNLRRATATDLLRNVVGATVYVLRLHDASPTSERVMLFIATGTGTARVSITSGIVSGKATVGGRTLDADSFALVDSTNNVSTSAYQIQTGVYDYANTDVSIFLDASFEGLNASYQTATTTSNTQSAGTFNMGVGALPGFALPFDGKIGEILVYHSAHTAGQRQAVWGYLAKKWGLTI